jgi:hypothetical protein
VAKGKKGQEKGTGKKTSGGKIKIVGRHLLTKDEICYNKYYGMRF